MDYGSEYKFAKKAGFFQSTSMRLGAYQFTAEGFLSVQKFPERLMTSMSGKDSSSVLRAVRQALLIMFMP